MRSVNRLMVSLCALAVIGGIAAYGANQQPAGATMPPPKVDVYAVTGAEAVGVRFEYPARLSAYRSTTVTARVNGVLQEKYYTEGAFVAKGSPMYRIEPDTYSAAVEAAAAAVELKSATLANAKREWDRVENLYRNNAISTKEYDAALSAYEVAKADLSSAKAQLKSSKINLGYTRVVAPIGGIAGMKQIDVGNVVNAGTPLVSLTQIDPIYAEFSIPDSDMQKSGSSLRRLAGTSALKAVLTYEGKSYSGTVDFVAPQISTTNGSVKVRARLSNSDNTLMPGAFGRIAIAGVQSAPVIKVPQKAVLQNKQGTIVMVVDNGRVGIRPIRLGKKAGEYFIIEDGLKGGETVIVNNFFHIQPGAPVTIDKTVR